MVLYLFYMHQFYTTHRVIDGKWEVIIWIYEEEDFAGYKPNCPNLRKLIADNYSSEPIDLAKLILVKLPSLYRMMNNQSSLVLQTSHKLLISDSALLR